jgi:hypothetical protein
MSEAGLSDYYSVVDEMSSWNCRVPPSSSKRVRPNVRSTELARFELNDKRMLFESKLSEVTWTGKKNRGGGGGGGGIGEVDELKKR